MHSLTTTTQTLTLQLAGNVTTNQVQCIVTFEGIQNGTPQGGSPFPIEEVQQTLTNGATPVTVLAAPQQGYKSRVTKITIVNLDTVAQTPVLKFADSATSAPAPTAIIFQPVLQTLESAVFNDGDGWTCFDANGAQKSQAAATSSGTSTADSKAVSVATALSTETSTVTAQSTVTSSAVSSATIATSTAESTAVAASTNQSLGSSAGWSGSISKTKSSFGF